MSVSAVTVVLLNVFLWVVSLFQNSVVLTPAEVFKLKSCIRRKTDSIDKRFCFDVEVVERSVARGLPGG